MWNSFTRWSDEMTHLLGQFLECQNWTNPCVSIYLKLSTTKKQAADLFIWFQRVWKLEHLRPNKPQMFFE